MRRTSSRQALVEALDLERAAAQHRVAVLAHELQRGVAARAGLGVERVTRLLGLVGVGRATSTGRSGPLGPWRSGVYCGSTSTQKATSRCARSRGGLDRGARRRAAAARALGRLDHDLEALAPAQAEQRRRPEHLGARPRPSTAARRARRGARRARRPRRSRRPGSGRRTAGSAARRGARARPPGSPARRGGGGGDRRRRRARSSARARGRRARRARRGRRAGRSARTSAPRRGSRGSAASSRRRARRRA